MRDDVVEDQRRSNVQRPSSATTRTSASPRTTDLPKRKKVDPPGAYRSLRDWSQSAQRCQPRVRAVAWSEQAANRRDTNPSSLGPCGKHAPGQATPQQQREPRP
jgi:hypothetical protein